MDMNIDNYMKVNYKIKGNIDINRTTASNIKELEKRGVQINLFIAGLLDNFNYEKTLNSLNSHDGMNEDESKNDIDSNKVIENV